MKHKVPTVTVTISGECSEPLMDIARRIDSVFEGYGNITIIEKGKAKPSFDGLSHDEEVIIVVDHSKEE